MAIATLKTQAAPKLTLPVDKDNALEVVALLRRIDKYVSVGR